VRRTIRAHTARWSLPAIGSTPAATLRHAPLVARSRLLQLLDGEDDAPMRLRRGR
jgi:hypothetical protein